MEVTVKRRKKIIPNDVFLALARERARWASEVVKLYELGVHDWKQQPNFLPIHVDGGGNRDVVNVYAHGAVEAIYRQIDAGFDRMVEVTDNYQSKTLPGILTSRPGRGGLKRGPGGKPVLLASPMPVIPREFTAQIAARIKPEFLYAMRAAFQKAIRISE